MTPAADELGSRDLIQPGVIVMPHARHPLHREFPEHQEQLRALLASDSHFGQLAERYEALDKRIYAVEDGREPLDDVALQTLKNQRVTLTEQIAERLRQAASGG